jgi:hypothetical protein
MIYENHSSIGKHHDGTRCVREAARQRAPQAQRQIRAELDMVLESGDGSVSEDGRTVA